MNPRKTELGEYLSGTQQEDIIDQRLQKLQNELISKMGRHWNLHSLLFLKRQSLSRILFLNDIYRKIIEVPGCIIEFGVQWGASLTILMHLRGIYEPYNYSRKIIGFDTFDGFVEITKEDGPNINVGDYRTKDNYFEQLSEILEIQESLSPLGHIKKHQLVKGDVCETLSDWKRQNPEFVLALGLFDMDLHKPTKAALMGVLENCVVGTVLVFDEFNCDKFPGETKAVFDVLGNKRIKRVPNMPYCAYWTYE